MRGNPAGRCWESITRIPMTRRTPRSTTVTMPWYSYLILSVPRRVAGDLNAWQLRDDRSGFDPVDFGEREE